MVISIFFAHDTCVGYTSQAMYVSVDCTTCTSERRSTTSTWMDLFFRMHQIADEPIKSTMTFCEHKCLGTHERRIRWVDEEEEETLH